MTEMPLFAADQSAAYERWLAPTIFAPWARHAAQLVAAQVPRQVLELAAGTGAGTKELVAALPDVDLVATDLSADMLAHAAARVQGPRFEAVDAQELPYPDASFDAVVMLFGIMFVPDRARAFREVRRVLRPGASFVMTSWDGPGTAGHHAAFDETARALFPVDPPIIATRTPNRYRDVEVIRAELVAAGFGAVDVRRTSLSGPATAEGLANGFALGSPLLLTAHERGVDPQEVAAELKRRLTAHLGEGPFELSTTALVAVAR